MHNLRRRLPQRICDLEPSNMKLPKCSNSLMQCHLKQTWLWGTNELQRRKQALGISDFSCLFAITNLMDFHDTIPSAFKDDWENDLASQQN